MKKIIGIVIASLMFCNMGFAEIRLIEDTVVKGYASFYVATICVDGYKFVVTKDGEGRSMVQFFAEVPGDGMPGIPAWCGLKQ